MTSGLRVVYRLPRQMIDVDRLESSEINSNLNITCGVETSQVSIIVIFLQRDTDSIAFPEPLVVNRCLEGLAFAATCCSAPLCAVLI